MLWACVFFCTKPVLAIWLFSNMCIHSFKDLSIYLSIYLLGRNDFVYSNVGNLNRFESAALQSVGFCFHHNNKIADSLFAICSLQGLLIVLSQTSSNHLGWSLQDANHKVQHVVAGCFVSPLRMLSLSSWQDSSSFEGVGQVGGRNEPRRRSNAMATICTNKCLLKLLLVSQIFEVTMSECLPGWQPKGAPQKNTHTHTQTQTRFFEYSSKNLLVRIQCLTIS